MSFEPNTTPTISKTAPAVHRCLSAVIVLISVFAFILMLISGPAIAGAYTVEKHDDAITGQFVISPTKVELEMKPGETTSRDIVITNRTGSTLTVEMSVEDFEGSQDPSQATVFKGDEDSNWGARHWLEPEISSIVLKQGEAVSFHTKIAVPKTAEPGGRYAAVFASSTYESQDEQGSAVNITSRVGTLFLITVAGPRIEQGSLDKPEVPTLAEFGPIDIGLVFHNQGNVHLKPSGRIVITNIIGQTVAEIPAPEWVVLPDSSRRSVVRWDSHYLFGRYTVQAEIGYTSGSDPIIKTVTFWVIPWKILTAVIAGVVIIVVLIAWRVRRRRGASQMLEDEFEDQHAEHEAQSASGGRQDPAVAVTASANQALSRQAALNELFPSMGDTSIVDLDDLETQRLIRDLIGQELDLARAFIREGRTDEARNELLEARSAAQRIGLLAEIGMIDDMLHQL